MLTINIVCVGNLKENEKRISAFAKINVIEVKESEYGTSEKQIELAKKEEATKLSKYAQGYTVALEIKGKTLTSEKFAENISNLMINGNSQISFFIGGSFGLDADFSNSLNQKISFSALTFPHQLMRVILLEQIYRAFTILNGKTYHK